MLKNTLLFRLPFCFVFFKFTSFSLWETLSLNMVFLLTFCTTASEPTALPAFFLRNWRYPHQHQKTTSGLFSAFLSELCFLGPGRQPISFYLSDPRFSLVSFCFYVIPSRDSCWGLWLLEGVTVSLALKQASAVLCQCVMFISELHSASSSWVCVHSLIGPHSHLLSAPSPSVDGLFFPNT